MDVLALVAGAATLALWAARTGQSQSVQAHIVGGGSGVALLVAVQALGLARVMRARGWREAIPGVHVEKNSPSTGS